MTSKGPWNTEIELLQAVLSGQKGAFKTLYDLHSVKVYNIALSYLKNEEAAQDVTQDVFIKLHKSLGGFKVGSALSTWVYRITVNTCLNYLNKQKRLVLVEWTSGGNETIDFIHPGVVLENKESSTALYSVLDTLPNSQKTAFILSFIEELPRQEVADIMETSLKAVESLLQRAKGKMRKKLEILYPHRRK
ncbi:MAG: RNA polymerase sigma factor (sigma-70 family) [Luteibaculaceae bacterium]|jgi:RNA polymerase sigma factor (sigma-70 family)